MTASEAISYEEALFENIRLKEENDALKKQLNWFRKYLFGKKSERIVSQVDEKQLTFEGFEVEKPQEETRSVSAHDRKKSKRSGEEAITLPSDLPVEQTILDLPEEEKVCPETGEKLVKIGEEITHKLAFKPGSYFIKEIIRPKYAHPKKEEAGIFTAELPSSIIPKCRADESFLAAVITQKFADHMPLYRISEMYERNGLKISRKLLSQWVVRIGLELVPLYEEMRRKIMQGDVLFIDESPLKMQEKEKAKTTYMWVLADGSGYQFYDFKENRCHENAFEILKEYSGVVHSDKYGAYEILAQKKEIIWAPCWSHIRRKFFEAQTNPLFRDWVLRKIRYLFILERIAWSRSADERLRIRQEKEIPIIDELVERIKGRLLEGKDTPKSALRQALGYFCGLIPYLKNYTRHANARLDNNTAERAVRPLAIGRKNWLFVGSPKGGKAAAVLFSLVQTCRRIGADPQEYLEDVMRRILDHNSQKLHELLPDQWLLAQKRLS
jgi:transposase